MSAHPNAFAPRNQILLLIGMVGLVYFLVRGPVRAFQPGGNTDFLVVHNAQQVFNSGGNPYLREDTLEQARDGPLHNFLWHYANAALLYAPGFLFVFYPMGLVAATPAAWIWVVLELAAFGALVHLTARLVGLDRKRRLMLLAAVLYFAPIQTSMSHGQPGIFFCVLTVALLCCLKEHREAAAAVALGLLMIKPSFGVPALGSLLSEAAGVSRLWPLSSPSSHCSLFFRGTG